MMKKAKKINRNPVARAVKTIRPQVVVSKKAYNRKRVKRINLSNY